MDALGAGPRQRVERRFLGFVSAGRAVVGLAVVLAERGGDDVAHLPIVAWSGPGRIGANYGRRLRAEPQSESVGPVKTVSGSRAAASASWSWPWVAPSVFSQRWPPNVKPIQ